MSDPIVKLVIEMEAAARSVLGVGIDELDARRDLRMALLDAVCASERGKRAAVLRDTVLPREVRQWSA